MTEKCKCPFCECELNPDSCEFIFCRACQVKFVECKNCGQLFSEKLKTCPKCGKENE